MFVKMKHLDEYRTLGKKMITKDHLIQNQWWIDYKTFEYENMKLLNI